MTDERAIEDRIRARAHEIWEREGRPEGQGPRHWDEARLEIEAEERATSATGEATEATPDAPLADPAGAAGAPDLPPAAGLEGPDADLAGETELSPSGLDRAPM